MFLLTNITTLLIIQVNGARRSVEMNLASFLQNSQPQPADHVSQMWQKPKKDACQRPCQRVENWVPISEIIQNSGMPDEVGRLIRAHDGENFVDIGNTII